MVNYIYYHDFSQALTISLLLNFRSFKKGDEAKSEYRFDLLILKK